MATGSELFIASLIKAGATPAQATSKVVNICLQVFSEMQDADKARVFNEARERYEHEAGQLELTRKQIANNEARRNFDWETRYGEAETEIAREKRKLRDGLDQLHTELQALNDEREKLEAAETPEARDIIRRADYFTRAVEIKTVYDNTAYIYGLASILSGAEIEGSAERISTLMDAANRAGDAARKRK